MYYLIFLVIVCIAAVILSALNWHYYQAIVVADESNINTGVSKEAASNLLIVNIIILILSLIVLSVSIYYFFQHKDEFFSGNVAIVDNSSGQIVLRDAAPAPANNPPVTAAYSTAVIQPEPVVEPLVEEPDSVADESEESMRTGSSYGTFVQNLRRDNIPQ